MDVWPGIIQNVTVLALKPLSKTAALAALSILLALSAAIGYYAVVRTEDHKNNLSVVALLIPPEPQSVLLSDADSTVWESSPPPLINRDPFLPDDKPPAPETPRAVQTTESLFVSGILWDERVPTAIVNSTVVRIGDIIQGRTIVDIEPDRIYTMQDGVLLVVPLRRQPP